MISICILACSVPPTMANAVIDNTGSVLVGTVRHYQCLPGFINTGPMEMPCVETPHGPMWKTPESICISTSMYDSYEFLMEKNKNNVMPTCEVIHTYTLHILVSGKYTFCICLLSGGFIMVTHYKEKFAYLLCITVYN